MLSKSDGEPDYLSSNPLTGTATAATVIFGRAQINMCVAIWSLFIQYLTFVACIVWFWCCKSCKSWMPISLQQMLSPKSSWARLLQHGCCSTCCHSHIWVNTKYYVVSDVTPSCKSWRWQCLRSCSSPPTLHWNWNWISPDKATKTPPVLQCKSPFLPCFLRTVKFFSWSNAFPLVKGTTP